MAWATTAPTLCRFGAPGTTTDIVTALSGNTARYKAGRLDYRVALDYQFTDDVMVYASIATGCKGGGSNPRPFNAAQLIPFNPEKVTSHEIGFKSDFLDRKVRLIAAAFLNDYKELQIPVNACPTPPRASMPATPRSRASSLS